VQDGAKTFVGVYAALLLRDKISSTTDVYFTYSQASRAGCFNASAVPVTPSTKAPELVEPEKLDFLRDRHQVGAGQLVQLQRGNVPVQI